MSFSCLESTGIFSSFSISVLFSGILCLCFGFGLQSTRIRFIMEIEAKINKSFISLTLDWIEKRANIEHMVLKKWFIFNTSVLQLLLRLSMCPRRPLQPSQNITKIPHVFWPQAFMRKVLRLSLLLLGLVNFFKFRHDLSL